MSRFILDREDLSENFDEFLNADDSFGDEKLENLLSKHRERMVVEKDESAKLVESLQNKLALQKILVEEQREQYEKFNEIKSEANVELKERIEALKIENAKKQNENLATAMKMQAKLDETQRRHDKHLREVEALKKKITQLKDEKDEREKLFDNELEKQLDLRDNLVPALDSDFDKFLDIDDREFFNEDSQKVIAKHKIRMKASDQQRENLMKHLKEKTALQEKLIQEGKLVSESEVQELKREILELKNQVEEKDLERERSSRAFHKKLIELEKDRNEKIRTENEDEIQKSLLQMEMMRVKNLKIFETALDSMMNFQNNSNENIEKLIKKKLKDDDNQRKMLQNILMKKITEINNLPVKKQHKAHEFSKEILSVKNAIEMQTRKNVETVKLLAGKLGNSLENLNTLESNNPDLAQNNRKLEEELEKKYKLFENFKRETEEASKNELMLLEKNMNNLIPKVIPAVPTLVPPKKETFWSRLSNKLSDFAGYQYKITKHLELDKGTIEIRRISSIPLTNTPKDIQLQTEIFSSRIFAQTRLFKIECINRRTLILTHKRTGKVTRIEYNFSNYFLDGGSSLHVYDTENELFCVANASMGPDVYRKKSFSKQKFHNIHVGDQCLYMFQQRAELEFIMLENSTRNVIAIGQKNKTGFRLKMAQNVDYAFVLAVSVAFMNYNQGKVKTVGAAAVTIGAAAVTINF